MFFAALFWVYGDYKPQNRKSNSKKKTSPQSYKTQINILPSPGTAQLGQGATLLVWPQSIYYVFSSFLAEWRGKKIQIADIRAVFNFPRTVRVIETQGHGEGIFKKVLLFSRVWKVFSRSGIWPKYRAGIGKMKNILAESGIWLLPGKRESPKLGIREIATTQANVLAAKAAGVSLKPKPSVSA